MNEPSQRFQKTVTARKSSFLKTANFPAARLYGDVEEVNDKEVKVATKITIGTGREVKEVRRITAVERDHVRSTHTQLDRTVANSEIAESGRGPSEAAS